MKYNTQSPQDPYGSDRKSVVRLSNAGLTVGTKVMCPGGLRAVEDLRGGDKVLTKDYGYQALKCVAFRDVDLSIYADQAPIRFSRDSLGHEKPEDVFYLAPLQRLALRHPMFDMLFGGREVVATAGDLTHINGVEQVKGLRGITYVMLGFARLQLVFSGSLVLDMGAEGAKLARPALSSDEARLACSMIAPHMLKDAPAGFPLH